MPTIKQQVESLVAQYHTRSVEELCDFLEITRIETALSGSIRGFAVKILDQSFIYLTTFQSEEEKKVTLAHELGHIILHPSLNSLFLARSTLMQGSRYEKEADTFAAHLLLEDDLFDSQGFGFNTLEQISRSCGVPLQYVILKWEDLCHQDNTVFEGVRN